MNPDHLDHLESQFARLGARFRARPAPPVAPSAAGYSLDIQHDRRGARFELLVATNRRETVEAQVLQAKPHARHLLLLLRDGLPGRPPDRFLCGHDEREWFAAAVPNDRGVSNVRTAIDALKPLDVRREIERLGVSHKELDRRRTKAYTRQGEWFFIPQEHFRADESLVLRNEPLQRGRGKPHFAEFACRSGGEVVYISNKHPQGLTAKLYRQLLLQSPELKHLSWRTARRNPEVYVKGRIRHPDHATITLACWHLVRMNTESQAPSMRHLAFID